MAYTYAYGGDPNVTASHFDTTGWFIESPYTMPTGNLDSTGNQPIRIYSVSQDYATGSYSVTINYQGAVVGSGVFGTSGGSFYHRCTSTSGIVYFGRNSGNGSSTTLRQNNYVWTGGVCGSLVWATAPAAPTMLEATPQSGGAILVRFTGAGDTGGQPITGWKLQAATNSAFTTGVQTLDSTGTTTFAGTPGVRYWFRAAGRNDVVDALGRYGAWSSSLNALAFAGGSIYDAGAFVAATPSIYDAGAFVAATGSIYDAGAWVPIA